MNRTIEGIKPDFHLPTEIYIRQNILEEVDQIISKYGSRVIIVITSEDLGLFHDSVDTITRLLKGADIGCIVYDQLPAMPNTEDIDLAVSFIKKTNCDLVIGLGGVHSINAGKLIALLINNYIFCYDLLTKPELYNPPVSLITMPAYPVYGFEIAPVLFMKEIHHATNKTYYHESLYPVATIVDPVISTKIDEDLSMKSSLSTLAISTESVISTMNNDIINTYALKSIDLIFRNLPLSYRDLQNPNPRTYLSTASVMSGITFAIAYLSVTLSISLAISSVTDMDIESAMSVILPHIMEFNLTSSPGKYVQMSKVMGEDVRDITVIEAAIKAVEAIRKLELDINIPQRLSQYDLPKTALKDIAKLAISYPFNENTPRQLNASEIESILIASY